MSLLNAAKIVQKLTELLVICRRGVLRIFLDAELLLSLEILEQFLFFLCELHICFSFQFWLRRLVFGGRANFIHSPPIFFRGVSGIITKNERADKMSNDKKIVITTRDRVLRAWQNSTELVRDFESYAKESSDDGIAAELFQKFAVDEGLHAAELLKLLHIYQDGGAV